MTSWRVQAAKCCYLHARDAGCTCVGWVEDLGVPICVFDFILQWQKCISARLLQAGAKGGKGARQAGATCGQLQTDAQGRETQERSRGQVDVPFAFIDRHDDDTSASLDDVTLRPCTTADEWLSLRFATMRDRKVGCRLSASLVLHSLVASTSGDLTQVLMQKMGLSLAEMAHYTRTNSQTLISAAKI